MVFISPVLNILSRNIRTSSKLIIRDYNEIENLQSSITGTEKFVNFSLKKIQKNIEENLLKIRPGYKINYLDENQNFASDRNCWLVSLIDGLSNFKNAIPHFCTSISLKENNEIISSIVYDPLKDELFQAEKEKGCFLNDFRIKSSEKILSSILVSSFYKTLEFPNEVIQDFTKIKILGSPILDICYLAAGRADLIFHYGYNKSFYQLTNLILKEANCNSIVNESESNFFLASNRKTKQKLINI